MPGMNVVRAQLPHSFRAGLDREAKTLPFLPAVDLLDKRSRREQTLTNRAYPFARDRCADRIRHAQPEYGGRPVQYIRKRNEMPPNVVSRCCDSTRPP